MAIRIASIRSSMDLEITMRRSIAMALVGVALSLGASSSVLAAAPARETASARPGAQAVVATTLKWVAPFKHGAMSGKATLTVSSTYATGRLAISATGVKKGDHVVASIHFRTKGGKTGTIVSGQHSVTGSTGSTSFSFALSSAARKAIKADLAAGDMLKIRIVDGTVVATGVFAKA